MSCPRSRRTHFSQPLIFPGRCFLSGHFVHSGCQPCYGPRNSGQYPPRTLLPDSTFRLTPLCVCLCLCACVCVTYQTDFLWCEVYGFNIRRHLWGPQAGHFLISPSSLVHSPDLFISSHPTGLFYRMPLLENDFCNHLCCVCYIFSFPADSIFCPHVTPCGLFCKFHVFLPFSKNIYFILCAYVCACLFVCAPHASRSK